MFYAYVYILNLLHCIWVQFIMCCKHNAGTKRSNYTHKDLNSESPPISPSICPFKSIADNPLHIKKCKVENLCKKVSHQCPELQGSHENSKMNNAHNAVTLELLHLTPSQFIPQGSFDLSFQLGGRSVHASFKDMKTAAGPTDLQINLLP